MKKALYKRKEERYENTKVMERKATLKTSCIYSDNKKWLLK
jgi:hypothetical protein